MRVNKINEGRIKKIIFELFRETDERLKDLRNGKGIENDECLLNNWFDELIKRLEIEYGTSLFKDFQELLEKILIELEEDGLIKVMRMHPKVIDSWRIHITSEGIKTIVMGGFRLKKCKYVIENHKFPESIGGYRSKVPSYYCKLVESEGISPNEINETFCDALHMSELTEDIYIDERCKHYEPLKK